MRMDTLQFRRVIAETFWSNTDSKQQSGSHDSVALKRCFVLIEYRA